VDTDPEYLLANAEPAAAHRLDALSAIFDPWTFAHLQAIGLQSGWRCWEVGAGAGSVPDWLAAQVGADGAVLATDIDVSRMPLGPDTAFEVRRHQLGVDPPPGARFDLVHARLVLVHVTNRDQALAAMVDSLEPGGWLLVEEADPALQPLVCIDEAGPAEELANRLKAGFRTLLAAQGVDLAYGRTLPRRLRAAGLVDVEAQAYFPVTSPECAELEMASVTQIRERLVAAGLATAADIDNHLFNVAAGTLDLTVSPLISAWGRKPPAPDAAE
jgi:SAM-dependent methyltransferase